MSSIELANLEKVVLLRNRCVFRSRAVGLLTLCSIVVAGCDASPSTASQPASHPTGEAGASAGGGTAPIPSVSTPVDSSSPDAPPEAPGGRELLYENQESLGAINARPRRTHVDDTHVYWVNWGYFRGPKDGSEPREKLADGGLVLMPRAIQTDSERIYLKQETGVEVIARDGSARRLVSPPIEDPIPWDSTGVFDVAEDRLVFANVTCEAFAATRFDGSDPVTAAFDKDWEPGGAANVIVVDGVAYCVNQNHGVRWKIGDSEPSIIFDMPQDEVSFTAMTAAHNHLYLIDYGIAGLPQSAERLVLPAKPGDEPVTWCTGDRGQSTSVHYDAARNTLYWPRQATRPLDLRSCSFSSPPGRDTIRLDYESKGRDVRALAGDDDYFYWADEYGIWRAPKPEIE